MAPLTRILQAIERRIGNEIPLWHGTGVSPTELVKGAGTVAEPKFSSEFFRSGTGGMMQGPGLYASESPAVGKQYAKTVVNDKDWMPEYFRSVLESSPEVDKFEIINMINDISASKNKEKARQEAVRWMQKTLNPFDSGELIQTIKNAPISTFKITEPDKYLYKVAFPNERYLDWYNPSKGDISDIHKTVEKVTGAPVSPYLRHSTTGDAVTRNIEDSLRLKHIRDIESKGGFAGTFDLPENAVQDVFDKAGFAGTKYRGDQRTGNYMNYVLRHPERARILDAFKFGLPLTVGIGTYQTGSEL